jgi:PAS domain S-box-containing protein
LDSEGREQRLTEFFEAASLGLCILGPDGHVVDANRAELALLGYSREEYVGRAWCDVHVDPNHARSLLARLVTGAVLRHEPARLRCKNGDERDVVIDSNAELEAGRLVFARCITHDASEERSLAQSHAERNLLAATEAVQQRVGRDLHDGLGQVLVGAALSAQRLSERAPDALRGPLGQLVASLNDATTRVQNIARGLSPIRVADLTLGEALSEVCAATRTTAGVECTLEVHPSVGRRSESENAQICLIVQEATRNAVRHGHATQIRVELRATGGLTLLSVRDNGSGAPVDAKPGLGLESMRFRARRLGGTLVLENHERGGALLRCAWPARDPETD